MKSRCLAAICLALLANSNLLLAQQPTLPEVVVEPEEREPAPRIIYREPYDDTIPWDSDAIEYDAEPVGPYNQPAWTTQHPFAGTRVYVLPPGQVQFEQWVRPTWNRGEGKPDIRLLEEISIGLPGRFQLDLYERWNIEPNDADEQEANHEGVQIELRYALADWDEIPLNPTLYIEWIERGGPQEKPNKYEAKLLLGKQFGDYLFFATNFILEQEIEGDEREQELAWSTGLTVPVIDRFLMAGIETNWSGTTVKGSRSDPAEVFQIGPSIQIHPTNRTFLDVVALFGTTDESPKSQLYFVFTYQFGDRAGPSTGISRPAAGRGN